MTVLLTGCSLQNLDAPSSKLASAPSSSAVPDDPTPQTEVGPNVWLEVVPDSGHCPDRVGLWEFVLAFEGGADHTVVVDLAAIARLPVQVLRPAAQHVIYEAPLAAEYATCEGSARSAYLHLYAVDFSDGKVRFELDLTDSDGFREIRHADTSVNRPYVFWRAAE